MNTMLAVLSMTMTMKAGSEFYVKGWYENGTYQGLNYTLQDLPWGLLQESMHMCSYSVVMCHFSIKGPDSASALNQDFLL